MSRQIQIRRGTAAQHDSFTGAIGEITMDTTNKTIRVHDGVTAGGTVLAKKSEIPTTLPVPDNYDFVIETQLPTAQNNYTWYRKYRSGWVEMGGEITTNINTVTLPIEMANNHYILIRTQVGSESQSYYPAWVAGYNEKTTTSFTFSNASVDNIWYACGVAAE